MSKSTSSRPASASACRKTSRSTSSGSRFPLGNLIGGDIFSGRGPSISFKLLPYGSVVVDVANEFTSAGINQTLHRIVLTVSAGLSIVLPLSSVNATVQSGVVVAETIIVGGVPERYATYGAGGTLAQTDALLMMEED